MGVIPEELRPSIREQLDRLVLGDMPELLVWARTYGPDGAVLVPQPPEIWEHPDSNAVRMDDGRWHVVMPLYTEAEEPSDLSAEIIVNQDGSAVIQNVHVL